MPKKNLHKLKKHSSKSAQIAYQPPKLLITQLVILDLLIVLLNFYLIFGRTVTQAIAREEVQRSFPRVPTGSIPTDRLLRHIP